MQASSRILQGLEKKVKDPVYILRWVLHLRFWRSFCLNERKDEIQCFAFLICRPGAYVTFAHLGRAVS